MLNWDDNYHSSTIIRPPHFGSKFGPYINNNYRNTANIQSQDKNVQLDTQMGKN